MICWQLGPEIQPLLEIGPARRQLVTDGEEPAPRLAAMDHRDLHLLRLGQREELTGRAVEPGEQLGRNAMPGQVEKAVLTAGALDAPSDFGQGPGKVDDRQRHRTSLPTGSDSQRGSSLDTQILGCWITQTMPHKIPRMPTLNITLSLPQDEIDSIREA